MTIRDTFWLWGHHAGAHQGWKLPGISGVGLVEGGKILGIKNICRVVFKSIPQPPFDQETLDLATHFDKIVWSIIGDSSSQRNDSGKDDLDEVVRQAKLTPNVVGGIFDDFFFNDRPGARASLERTAEIAKKLHENSLKLWAVTYDLILKFDNQAYLDLFDIITFWTWKARNLDQVDANISETIRRAKGKDVYAGCYLFDYGDNRPMDAEVMERYLEKCRQLLHEGMIKGVIVCSNCVLGIGLEAEECLIRWLEAHGDEKI